MMPNLKPKCKIVIILRDKMNDLIHFKLKLLIAFNKATFAEIFDISC